MSFGAAKTHKGSIIKFKSGNMFKRPLVSSRILSGKPRYFINKPKITISKYVANKIFTKSNRLVGFEKKYVTRCDRFFTSNTGGMKSFSVFHRKPDEPENGFQWNFNKSGIRIGNEFINIENPQETPIEIWVFGDGAELVWNNEHKKYYLYDLKLNEFMPRLEIEKKQPSGKMPYEKSTLDAVLTFVPHLVISAVSAGGGLFSRFCSSWR